MLLSPCLHIPARFLALDFWDNMSVRTFELNHLTDPMENISFCGYMTTPPHPVQGK